MRLSRRSHRAQVSESEYDVIDGSHGLGVRFRDFEELPS